MTLTTQQMNEGIILLPCRKCGKVTQHQTLDKRGEPFKPHVMNLWNGSGRAGGKKHPFLKHTRKCLECGRKIKF